MSTDRVNIISLSGPEARPEAQRLAELRIAVFREFPYLYDGSQAYEEAYLETYFKCPQAVVVMAFDLDRLIGVSTGLPLEFAEAAFQQPFRDAGIDPSAVFYFGESVLLPKYRGHGVGHRFFNEREAWARLHGPFSITAFCAVNRPPDHPRRPAKYRPHDVFWTKRGYSRQDSLRARLAWKDVDEADESAKTLTFWTRAWTV